MQANIVKTEKLYYQNPYQSKCKAKIIDILPEGIIVDRSVAYAQGGGQIGDSGKISLKDGVILEFSDTKKLFSRMIFLPDFPTIGVDGQILLCCENTQNLNTGDEITLEIDIKKRAFATLHHSALHLALMALKQIRKGIDKDIYGCKITQEYGRLDFHTDKKFSSEELDFVQAKVNQMIKEALDMKCYSHESEKEAIYWQCLDEIIPCGGTHAQNTSYLKSAQVSRKNIGKSSDRMIIKLSDSNNFEDFLKLYKDFYE